LATLAVRLAAGWAFSQLNIDGLVAIVDERNLASRGVALAAGFELEGAAEPWEYSESGVMLRYAQSRGRWLQTTLEEGRVRRGEMLPNPALQLTTDLPPSGRSGGRS
jgi:RimJ/RimL family protein N-acetyltransferase